MQVVITGEKLIRPNYKMLFMRSASGQNLITHIDTRMGNSKHWWKLRKGDNLDNVHIKGGNIVNADFIPKVIRGS